MSKKLKTIGGMKKLIKKCEICKGTPVKSEPINLKDFEGTKCSECLLVISWKKKESNE